MIIDLLKLKIRNWHLSLIMIQSLYFNLPYLCPFEIDLWNPNNKKYTNIRIHRVETLKEALKLTNEISLNPLKFYKMWG